MTKPRQDSTKLPPMPLSELASLKALLRTPQRPSDKATRNAVRKTGGTRTR